VIEKKKIGAVARVQSIELVHEPRRRLQAKAALEEFRRRAEGAFVRATAPCLDPQQIQVELVDGIAVVGGDRQAIEVIDTRQTGRREYPRSERRAPAESRDVAELTSFETSQDR
jgi:hypothetical protein